VLRRILDEVPPDRLDQTLRAIASSQIQGANVLGVDVKGRGDAGADVVLTFGLTGGNWARRTPTGFALPVTQQPLGLLSEYASLPARRFPLLLDKQEFRHDVIRVKLPEGLEVVRPPEAVDQDTPFGRYALSVREEAGTLVVDRRAILPPRRIDPEDYPDFRAFAQRIDDAERAEIGVQVPSPSLGR
jgi:hypothetical protein